MKCHQCEKYLFMIEEQEKEMRRLEMEIKRLKELIEEIQYYKNGGNIPQINRSEG